MIIVLDPQNTLPSGNITPTTNRICVVVIAVSHTWPKYFPEGQVLALQTLRSEKSSCAFLEGSFFVFCSGPTNKHKPLDSRYIWKGGCETQGFFDIFFRLTDSQVLKLHVLLS